MPNNDLTPVMLLRSFLTVASGYVLSIVAYIGVLMVLGISFFPEFAEFMELDKPTQDAVMQNNPETAISPMLFRLTVIGTSIACIGIGWLVIRTAPFAPFPHAVFLAVLIFVYYLQMSIADPPPKKSMTIVYMVAFPIAVLLGARLGIGRYLSDRPAHDAE